MAVNNYTWNDPGLWVKNGSFTESAAEGRAYSSMVSNGSGSRIALAAPLPLPAASFTVYAASGFQISLLYFKQDDTYLGPTNGKPLIWQTAESGRALTRPANAEKFVVFLRRGTGSPALLPADVAEAGLYIQYEYELVGSAMIDLTTVVDVASCTRYYLLQSSTLSPPAKPTTEPPTGSWNDTEPTYTSGSTNSLYFCDLTVFSDGTWSYSSVSHSSSYEAAKEAYNKAQNAQTVAEKALSNTEIIVGTQTAATGAWTGVASFSSLVDGQQIVYWLPYAGSGNATLELILAGGNTTGAIPCYYGGTTRLTTHYGAGNAIHLTYRENANIGGTLYTGWWADANYYLNNVDRLQCAAAVYAAEAINAGRLAVFNAQGKIILLSARPFDITEPILYVGTTYTAANVSSSTFRVTNYLSWGTTFSLANTVSGFSGEARTAVYIKGTLSGRIFTPAAEVLTTTVPTTEDGYFYILLGFMSTTVNATLFPEHPIYRFHNGEFKAVSQISYEAFLAAEEAQETADTNTISIQRLDQSVSGLTTQFNVFSSGIEATIEDHSDILSAMSFSTEGLKVQMAGSIYYTLTDDVGYHIYQNNKEIAAFSEGKGSMEQLQMGNIICRKTSKGGWVWTEGT